MCSKYEHTYLSPDPQMNIVICVARQAVVLGINFDLSGIKFATKLARYYLALAANTCATPRNGRCVSAHLLGCPKAVLNTYVPASVLALVALALM